MSAGRMDESGNGAGPTRRRRECHHRWSLEEAARRAQDELDRLEQGERNLILALLFGTDPRTIETLEAGSRLISEALDRVRARLCPPCRRCGRKSISASGRDPMKPPVSPERARRHAVTVPPPAAESLDNGCESLRTAEQPQRVTGCGTAPRPRPVGGHSEPSPLIGLLCGGPAVHSCPGWRAC